MLQFLSLFTVVESKFQWTETAVLCCKTQRLRGRYTSERSSDVVLAWNTCLLHLALPSRFWTMMSSYSSHHFLFPQNFRAGSKLNFWEPQCGLDEPWYTLLLKLRTVSQKTRGILKARSDVITVESFAGDGAYCCRFQYGIKSTQNSEERILICISGFCCPSPIIPLFPHLQVRRHKWRPGVRAWKCTRVSH